MEIGRELCIKEKFLKQTLPRAAAPSAIERTGGASAAVATTAAPAPARKRDAPSAGLSERAEKWKRAATAAAALHSRPK